MGLLKAGPPKARRGAAVPLPIDKIVPTGPLNERETEIFRLAAFTRPGFWALGDMLILTSYARTYARLEALETANPPASEADIIRAQTGMIALGRILRLSPYARDVKEGAVAPATEQQETGQVVPHRTARDANPWGQAA